MTKPKNIKIQDRILSTKESPVFPTALDGKEQPEEGFETEYEAREWFVEANIHQLADGFLNDPYPARYFFSKV